MKLSQLEKGEAARIISVGGEGSLRQHFLDMGLIPGKTIRFIKEAGADSAVLQIKSLEAFEKAADGKATKIIIPSEIQGMAGLARSVVETIKDN